MDRFLTNGQLHRLLEAAGHGFWSAQPIDTPIDVSPPPDMYLTVGLIADGALRPAYRDRYFACRRNADDPVILGAPAFALDGAFAEAAADDPGNNYFVLGPFRWLLARVRHFGQVLLWPKGGFRGDNGLDFLLTTADGERLRQAPHMARWFGHHANGSARGAAIVLDLAERVDCEVLWEAANLVGVDCYDFFLGDPSGREVYQLHHHDKVVVSIPDEPRRPELMADLAGLADVFEDCSGYRSIGDEEYSGD